MLIIAIIPFIVMIVGILMAALTTNAVLNKAGWIMFGCGLLVTLFVFAKSTIKIS